MTTRERQRLQQLFSTAQFRQRYAMMRAITGSMRVKILTILRSRRQGLTISELSEVLHASLSRISHQIRILRQLGIVNAKRDQRGRSVYHLRPTRLIRILI